MNRKILLGAIVVLTLVTALIHLSLGGGMLAMAGGGGPRGGQGGTVQGGQPSTGGQPPAGGQPSIGGQPPAGGQLPQGGGPRGGLLGFGIFRYLPYLFVLNGLGYLVLLALLAFRVPYFRDHAALAHWLLIGFAAVTLVMYFLVQGFGPFLRNVPAIASKTAELLLIVVTFLRLRAVQSMPAVSAPATPAQA